MLSLNCSPMRLMVAESIPWECEFVTWSITADERGTCLPGQGTSMRTMPRTWTPFRMSLLAASKATTPPNDHPVLHR